MIAKHGSVIRVSRNNNDDPMFENNNAEKEQASKANSRSRSLLPGSGGRTSVKSEN